MPQWIATPTGSFLTYGHEVTLSALGFQFAVIVFFAADEWFNRDVLGRHGHICTGASAGDQPSKKPSIRLWSLLVSFT